MTEPLTVTTVYLWLEGCNPAEVGSLAVLERVLLAAAHAANFTVLHHHCSENAGKAVALAVVGESHLILHGEPGAGSLCAEVVSCTTADAAASAIASVRAAIQHAEAKQEILRYSLLPMGSDF